MTLKEFVHQEELKAQEVMKKEPNLDTAAFSSAYQEWWGPAFDSLTPEDQLEVMAFATGKPSKVFQLALEDELIIHNAMRAKNAN